MNTADDNINNNLGSSSNESQNHQSNPHQPTRSRKRDSPSQPDHKQDNNDEDNEVWKQFNSGFQQVQSVLNRNRILIQQVNENHRSKIYSNMVKNVALIQEMNANISKIVSLYSDLSSDFSTVFHQQRDGGGDGNCVEGSSD